ncbi:MAG: nucleoside triphosphate pyrophosphatase [Longimicrobiales bacterium]|nr:nucleoside triphosphate pyrophosphatase [Longimicrobiales bacterium]
MTGPRAVPPLVLASASPRRARLLRQIGLTFAVDPARVDEAALPDETAADHVRRLALEKARTVAARHPAAVVIGGDTVVVLDDEILTKPASLADAVATLLRLQGREHRVESGVAMVAPDGRVASAVVGADVRFRPFDAGLAEAYVATGEPMDKAGGYGIQGKGAVLVESIRGDYFTIMGLPVARLVRMLEELGYRFDFDGAVMHADDQ